MRYEEEVVHPAVARWLIRFGYQFDHEVRTQQGGRIDFVARKDDAILIVECKNDCSKIVKAVEQVQNYRQAYLPSASMAIAVPIDTITPEAMKKCHKRSIRLIGVDVPVRADCPLYLYSRSLPTPPTPAERQWRAFLEEFNASISALPERIADAIQKGLEEALADQRADRSS